jgi:hypothetical protein
MNREPLWSRIMWTAFAVVVIVVIPVVLVLGVYSSGSEV